MTDSTGASVKTGGLAGLAQAARAAEPAGEKASGRGLPPVHLWNPPDCGDIDMRIAADGTWYYLGTPIGRPAMVRLFSTILRRDAERYVLVTPVEKVGIKVDDAPFVAVGLDVLGMGPEQTLRFRTNVEDVTDAGPDHLLRVTTDPASGAPRPYIHVRDGLEALIGRAVFYDLVNHAVPRDGAQGAELGVWSRGVFFPLGPLPEGWV